MRQKRWYRRALIWCGGALMALCLVGAAPPAGCGGNLTDNCLQDRDCLGGQFCSSGVCKEFVGPPKERSQPDGGPGQDTPTKDTPDSPAKSCPAQGCPAGTYCTTAGTCDALPPAAKGFCDYQVDASGMMAAPGQIIKLPGFEGSTRDAGLAVSPDGRYAAILTRTSHKDRLKLWDLQSGKLVRSFETEQIVWHSQMTPYVQFSRDSKRLYANYCSIGSGGAQPIHCSELRGWTLSDGARLGLTKRFGGKVYRIAFSPGNKYVATIQENTSHNDPAIKIWQVGAAKPSYQHPLATKYRAAYHSSHASNDICQSNSDCWANESCIATDRGVKLCFVNDRKGFHARLVTSMVINDTGVVFSSDTTGQIVRWDSRGGKELQSSEASRTPLSMSLHPDQSRVVVGMMAVKTKNGQPNGSVGHLSIFSVKDGTRTKDFDIAAGAYPTDARFWLEDRLLLTFGAVGYTWNSSAGWGVWHGTAGRPVHHEQYHRTPEQITRRIGTSWNVANSLDDRVRVALFVLSRDTQLHVWRCGDPCKGVKCKSGSFCQYGRCVTSQAECSGAEVRTCYTGPKDKLDIGECRAGTEICLGSHWRGRCHQEQSPQIELCNQKDDDCDGQVDDQCITTCTNDNNCSPISTGTVCRNYRCVPKACKSGYDCAKGQICEKGTCQACVASKEICDGKDNDCDGAIDEGCKCQAAAMRRCPDQLGQSCNTGVKYQLCVRYIPNPDAQWTRCLCQPSSRCNQDSDCGSGKDMLCEHNACVPKPCKQSSDCPHSKSCQYGVCAKTQCNAHADCAHLGQSQLCIAGRCFDGNADPAP